MTAVRANALPANAVMEPTAERALFQRDYHAWLAYAAPRITAIIRDTTQPGAIALTWSLMGRDMQRAVWDELDLATRQRVRDARADGAVDPDAILSRRMERRA